MRLERGNRHGLLTALRKTSRVRIALAWALAFVVGLGVGRWWAGGAAPVPPAPAPVAQLGAREPAPVPSPPRALPAETGEGTRPPAPDDPRDDLVRGLAGYTGDPAEVLGVVVDTLRDDEIIAALSTATGMQAEDLRDVRDPRALARRMSAIALEDLIATPEDEPSDLAPVYFSDESLPGDPSRAGDRARRKFERGETILATFPSDAFPGDRVFMKWTRLDDPEVVLFRTFPIRPGARYSEIPLEADRALPPGRYKVAFYSADEAMEPVASGRYSVVAPASGAD